ncbi:hypothetical protein GCWU000341_00131 [Oribacterium sp. oral taxon 078 str. F0262]|nr:hypothetical protein GCWU000341_00131 [Oribacterium sp. oral taxon 078 str. F0262]
MRRDLILPLPRRFSERGPVRQAPFRRGGGPVKRRERPLQRRGDPVKKEALQGRGGALLKKREGPVKKRERLCKEGGVLRR